MKEVVICCARLLNHFRKRKSYDIRSRAAIWLCHDASINMHQAQHLVDNKWTKMCVSGLFVYIFWHLQFVWRCRHRRRCRCVLGALCCCCCCRLFLSTVSLSLSTTKIVAASLSVYLCCIGLYWVVFACVCAILRCACACIQCLFICSFSIRSVKFIVSTNTATANDS